MPTTPHAAPTFMDQLSRIKAEAARAQIDTSRLKRSLDEFLSTAEARDPDIVGFWADESGSESNNSQADRPHATNGNNERDGNNHKRHAGCSWTPMPCHSASGVGGPGFDPNPSGVAPMAGVAERYFPA